MRAISSILLASSLVLAAAAARAADDPRALMEKVFNRSSWHDMKGEVRLTLTNGRGDQKVRELDMWSKKNARGESSMLMRFVRPADVRGTGFLLIEHDGGEDDRRLFLPALRRINRISASGSGGNFMSSDFTYYDIGRPKLADWTYGWADGKTVDGVACKGVQGLPASKKVQEDTGYAKVVWYVDPARLVVLAADYYDAAGMKLKELHAVTIEQVDGVPFATRMRVTDVNTGHSSELWFEELKTNQGLGDDLFTSRNLRRWTR